MQLVCARGPLGSKEDPMLQQDGQLRTKDFQETRSAEEV